RFELVVGLLLRQFSKLVVSATHPPLQNMFPTKASLCRHRGLFRFANAKLSFFFCFSKSFLLFLRGMHSGKVAINRVHNDNPYGRLFNDVIDGAGPGVGDRHISGGELPSGHVVSSAYFL
ncbi:MAG: hypothetical protein K2I45_06150, partial [Muribaculaceae bacterium]|nr:hypothetical protein [Muribaculaceae bacterium]